MGKPKAGPTDSHSVGVEHQISHGVRGSRGKGMCPRAIGPKQWLVSKTARQGGFEGAADVGAGVSKCRRLGVRLWDVPGK